MSSWYNEVVRRTRPSLGRKRCAQLCVTLSLVAPGCVTTTYREQTTLEETKKEVDRDGPVIEFFAAIDGAPLPVLMDLVSHPPEGARLEVRAIARHPLGVYRSVLVGSITLYCAAPALGGARTAHAFELTSESAGPEHDPAAPQPEERVLEWGVELGAYEEQCLRRGLALAEIQGILEVQAVGANGHLGRSPSWGFLTR